MMTRRDTLLTADDLAEILAVRPITVLGWYRKGVIPGIRLGHKIIRFNLTEVVNALEVRERRKEVGRG